MIKYLELPDVNWLEAEGLQVLDDQYIPDDSAGEYLGVVLGALSDAVWQIEYLDQ